MTTEAVDLSWRGAVVSYNCLTWNDDGSVRWLRFDRRCVFPHLCPGRACRICWWVRTHPDRPRVVMHAAKRRD